MKLYDITRKYQKCDIYNFDETALFYRLEPNKTLASVGTNAVGRKEYKERITVGVCNNANGSDKYPLCVICKYKSPRAFGKSFNPNSIVDYYYNHKGWMTIRVFKDWFEKFNKRMKERNKQALLLVDNAAGHLTDKKVLSNASLEFLYPNLTSEMQPQDQGIIKCWKGGYRKELVHDLIIAADNDKEVSSPNIKQAFYYSVRSYNKLKRSTIVNSWNQTDIINDDREESAKVKLYILEISPSIS